MRIAIDLSSLHLSNWSLIHYKALEENCRKLHVPETTDRTRKVKVIEILIGMASGG